MNKGYKGQHIFTNESESADSTPFSSSHGMTTFSKEKLGGENELIKNNASKGNYNNAANRSINDKRLNNYLMQAQKMIK